MHSPELSAPEASTSTGWQSLRVYRDLYDSLQKPYYETPPDIVWNMYFDLMHSNASGLDRLPLDFHQSVLKRCIPSSYFSRQEAWKTAPRRVSAKAVSLSAPYRYSSRVLEVLENIRRSGFYPQIEDYHIVLNQYAAVGNARGSQELLKDLKSSGCIPTERTYTYVLLALARKLSLAPTWEPGRSAMIQIVVDACRSLIDEMRASNVPQSPKILDLCMRIISASGSLSSFRSLLEIMYGIDIMQPDVVPPRVLARYQEMVRAAEQNGQPSPTLPPISAAALNTIIHRLGTGEERSVALMAGAYESLTSPLPPLRSPEQAYGYDDADDDEPHVALSYSTEGHSIPPRATAAQPNTQTFTYLIRNSVEMKNKVYARHYLGQAIDMEQTQIERVIDAVSQIIRPDPGSKDIIISPANIALVHAVPRPTVTTNVYMFKSVYRLADRRTDVNLMAWLLRRERETVNRKRRYFEFVKALAAVLQSPSSHDIEPGSVSLSSDSLTEDSLKHGRKHASEASDGALDLEATIAVTRQHIYEMRQHIGVVRDQGSAADTFIPRTSAAIVRLAQRKIRAEVRKQATATATASTTTQIKQTPRVEKKGETAEDLKRQWFSSLYWRRFRSRREPIPPPNDL